MTVQVSLCLFGVNETKVKKNKSDIISCLKEHKVLLCWTAVTQTPVLLLHEDQSKVLLCWTAVTQTPVLLLRED